uniref:THAP-type domain-containing protein n=1 Tax=Anopheles dirus TaxID=7168 RepID=A0A182NVN0_9DIPT
EHLVKVLKKLNLCQGSDDKITVERLALEVATYGRVTKFTKFEYDPSKVKVPEQTESPETMLISDDEDGTGRDENTLTTEDLSFISAPAPKKPQKRQLKDEIEYARPRGKFKMVKKEHRNLKRWVCPYVDICNNYYLDESALQQHVRVDHKTFKCKTCGYSMEFYEIYKKHVESHAVARALLISHSKTTPIKFFKCDSSTYIHTHIMPNEKCSAAFCTNSRKNAKSRELDIIFHGFPAEGELRQRWIKFCQNPEGWTPFKTSVMCSVHFKPEDYQMMRSPLIKENVIYRKLQLNAVPSVKKCMPVPINVKKKLDEQIRKQLYEEHYRKDNTHTSATDDDVAYWELPKKKKLKLNAGPKIVYRLQKFPKVCAFCLKEVDNENLFLPFSFYHHDLQCTIEEKFDEIADESSADQKDRGDVRHLLPNKICCECLDTLVKFHQFQKQLKCVRKFSTGVGKLFKGSRTNLEDQYKEEGAHLIRVLRKLNICEGSDDKITVERLAKEAANYRPVPNSVGLNRDQPKAKVLAQYLNRETFRTETVNDYEEPGSAEIEWNEIVMPAPKTRTTNDAIPLVTSRKYKTARKEQRGAKQWVCPYPDICKEWFLDEAALQQHVRVDHKTFKCRTCGAKFAFYDLYKRHIESHAIARALLATHNKNSTAKEFECDCCDKKFRSEEVFLRHQNIHVGERNYVCGTCLAVYLDAKEFKYHKCSVPNADQPDTSDDTLAEHLYAKPTAAEHATETAELSTLTNNSDFSTGNQLPNDIEWLSIEILDVADS